ncbi:oxidoreductase [Devosia pacifica]|uniref:Oxidoreductase n=1 Tax=Devosia pacifica TaxID=1335967 RepID=A0A918VY70_9HYPH|nr:SDR family oxidoreductase [Devosia pacifica]GHA34874.1 oxidoreductase [Devosia pacifica]
MDHDFKDKVALVTGAASGIGAAVAHQLAERGAKVVLGDLNKDGAEAVVEAIRANGGEATAVAVDVGVASEMEALVEKCRSTYGALHYAVNNAGIGGPAAPTGEYPLEGWSKVIEINLNSVFYGLRYEIPAILESGGGAIVNMASILGSVGFANSVAYVAAKHGVVGMTKAAAAEYAKQNIRINSVGPGFIDTPLLSQNLDKQALEYIQSLHPIGRLGTPEEVAALTVFLLSPAAGFITGSYHLADGGYTAV